MGRKENICQATKRNEKEVIENETIHETGGRGEQKRTKTCQKCFQFGVSCEEEKEKFCLMWFEKYASNIECTMWVTGESVGKQGRLCVYIFRKPCSRKSGKSFPYYIKQCSALPRVRCIRCNIYTGSEKMKP
jgi:hypothetical protein